jgi:ribose-phosphate pyrophosphokinase
MAADAPTGIALGDEPGYMETPPAMEDALIVAGSASRALGADIAARLGLPLAAGEVIRFSEGNLFVRVMENVRGRHVYLIQGTVFPANDRFMELLFWIDALKRASAASVTAVIPYFSYAKGDKKDEPRVSIRARVCADAIEAAGADRVVTMDLHAPQVQGFFHIPVDDLYALPVLCDAIHAAGLGAVTVVAPDAGFAKKAQRFARRLDDAWRPRSRTSSASITRSGRRSSRSWETCGAERRCSSTTS